MNNALFTSKTGLWETPQEFFDKLNRMGAFGAIRCMADRLASGSKKRI